MNKTYDYNRKTYSVVTLRINKNKDAGIIEHLAKKPSVNSYLLDLIRHDMEQTGTDGTYEVIEDRGIQKQVLATYDNLKQAAEFVLLYVAGFDVGGRVYIAERFTGRLGDTDVPAGIVQNLQVETEESKKC